MDPRVRGDDRISVSGHRLRLQRHAILCQHIGLNRRRQRHHLRPSRPAVIDQHQCLFRVHARCAQVAPFPAALIDQPAGCQLLAAIRLRMVHQRRKALEQRGALF